MTGYRVNRLNSVEHLTRELDDRALQPQAQAQERNAIDPCPADGADLALHAAVPEATWYHDAMQPLEQAFAIVVRLFDTLGVDELDDWLAIVRPRGVKDRFTHGDVGVLQLDVLADDANDDFVLDGPRAMHQLPPAVQIGLG